MLRRVNGIFVASKHKKSFIPLEENVLLKPSSHQKIRFFKDKINAQKSVALQRVLEVECHFISAQSWREIISHH